ncbi:MAG TPA: FkbM family methyltransferase [Beijerinckiaceae bacterium]|jgi:FkbM family methyltransferase
MNLSYAQNLEDYHLAQVFAGKTEGFYVDVGAGHPVGDNVSFHFYLEGWRGIVVEPQERLARLYAALRPRDVAVAALVGAAEGEAAFHEVERLHGFSTMVEGHAKGAEKFGASYTTRRRPVTTLASLCAAHAPGEIDFFKVDVEGAEAEVLAGADWRRFRPRVVLVEAVAPGDMAPSHEAWEPILTGHGYAFAFFDGLNRFYVADEAAALKARFPEKPAPWDAVRHLYEFGRAPENPQHPDHALAKALVKACLAALPTLSPEALRALMGAGVAGPEAERLLAGLDTDAFRAALGRIAAPYDGGQLLDD